jgi:hypothetical protein
LQLLPSTAACPASYPYQCLPRVVVGDKHLFAALWEGQGGAQAARYCVAQCYEVLQGCLAKGASDPGTALQEAVQQLEKSFFEADLPDLVGGCLIGWCQQQRCYVQRDPSAAGHCS